MPFRWNLRGQQSHPRTTTPRHRPRRHHLSSRSDKTCAPWSLSLREGFRSSSFDQQMAQATMLAMLSRARTSSRLSTLAASMGSVKLGWLRRKRHTRMARHTDGRCVSYDSFGLTRWFYVLVFVCTYAVYVYVSSLRSFTITVTFRPSLPPLPHLSSSRPPHIPPIRSPPPVIDASWGVPVSFPFDLRVRCACWSCLISCCLTGQTVRSVDLSCRHYCGLCRNSHLVRAVGNRLGDPILVEVNP